MAPDDRWLAAVWPFVRGQLPPAPATVLEVGCGTLGGFVPALGERGYQALGVDPEAPEGSDYQRVEFEQYEAPAPSGLRGGVPVAASCGRPGCGLGPAAGPAGARWEAGGGLVVP